ncbi:unnamed protein product [Haemonchus placei]|uniref:Inner membrane protein n=1 Tax=Haemonchus placei TaxID=6290 RepID=A0A0N4WU19_HAEPC|nr:unnamed protein product [Haemonchus placei]
MVNDGIKLLLRLVLKFVVAYIVIWAILLMQLPLPPYTIIISLIGFATCVCTVIGIIIKNPRLLMPFWIVHIRLMHNYCGFFRGYFSLERI